MGHIAHLRTFPSKKQARAKWINRKRFLNVVNAIYYVANYFLLELDMAFNLESPLLKDFFGVLPGFDVLRTTDTRHTYM